MRARRGSRIFQSWDQAGELDTAGRTLALLAADHRGGLIVVSGCIWPDRTEGKFGVLISAPLIRMQLAEIEGERDKSHAKMIKVILKQ